MKSIKIKAFKVSQPIGEFYCGKIKASDLVDITYSDVRRMSDSENRELDDYIGIQRPLIESRVKAIRNFISGVDSSFPNSIIIAMSSDNVNWDEYNNDFIITPNNDGDFSKLAKILDGQHRIAGFDKNNMTFINELGDESEFELLVTVFVDADISTQANVFSTVNLAQTKVNKSLVYDLESLAYSRSPEKTCHDIAVLLNKEKNGPFEKRIKRLGVATPKISNETLTQAAFVENLLKLITFDAKSDRNYFLAKEKGGKISKEYNLEKIDNSSLIKYPLRKSFIAEKDSVIAANVSNFFSAVMKLWPNAWNKSNKISSLNKTIGLIALFRVLKDILSYMNERYNIDALRVLSIDDFSQILDGGDLDENAFMQLDAVSKSSKIIYDMICGNLALYDDEDA
ncbi:TPA: DGQHR domain-containing protein [Salmonella enterica]|uniref:DGQHR domain-containing protein n=2 Tax=Salmonella enterica TaxID=28901 RepID=A0A737YD53_SALER|nr:DGQHR domain-containing protein [Salmonella enterica]EAV3186178.1 DGQHR domain-containing protein [Salmonella enterica subsp. enterica]ECT9716786.1 DGQHR domain-containing protein [Salmonella enterica subsp. diarizonae str. CFSAN000553]EEM6162018.1 DGQHR domain-containing protein [Salmonella enterica subsp. enterica serovar Brazzaville]HAE8613044.1 DGQHR domain-containing protein [Salmonella enterica subsp. salamae serovar 30:1,z28:z6]HAF0276036.1 DGQHR domain-containing protein [Salmonella